MKEDITQELFETIEQYLLGEMDAAAKADFERRIKADEPLGQKVEEFRILFAGAEEAVLKLKLEAFHQDLSKTGTTVSSSGKVRKLSFLRYLVAASVALLICFGGWWIFNQSNANEKLFTQFFEPDPGLATTMSVSEAYIFNRGMVDYKSGKYQEAITNWQSLHLQNPGNDTLSFFMGVSHLAAGNAEKAIPYLQTVVDRQNSAFNKEAVWYQGLAYMRNGDVAEAKKRIEASDHPQKNALLSNLK